MNPVVLIATDSRVQITQRNIESLKAQSIIPKISVVVSQVLEEAYFKYYADRVIMHPNRPLGNKWQFGINKLCLDADPLIITGSDDILAPGFVARACELVEQGYDFIGLNQFWQHHNGTAYLCNYNTKQPIGGGRIFSKKALQVLGYRLFDSRDKHLDDYAWNRLLSTKLKVKLIDDIDKEGMSIHAIKGNWPMINKFNINHKNISVLRHRESEYIQLKQSEAGNSFVNDDLA
jgi:hypothetical protein